MLMIVFFSAYNKNEEEYISSSILIDLLTNHNYHIPPEVIRGVEKPSKDTHFDGRSVRTECLNNLHYSYNVSYNYYHCK